MHQLMNKQACLGSHLVCLKSKQAANSILLIILVPPAICSVLKTDLKRGLCPQKNNGKPKVLKSCEYWSTKRPQQSLECDFPSCDFSCTKFSYNWKEMPFLQCLREHHKKMCVLMGCCGQFLVTAKHVKLFFLRFVVDGITKRTTTT